MHSSQSYLQSHLIFNNHFYGKVYVRSWKRKEYFFVCGMWIVDCGLWNWNNGRMRNHIKSHRIVTNKIYI